MPVSAVKTNVTQTQSVQNDHTDEPLAAKKKKTTKYADVRKVVYFTLLYNFKLLLCI